MTQEEKDLLLEDLCARLPYGVICDSGITIGKLCGSDIDKLINKKSICVKPYLRPISSMTEEEKDYIKNVARFKQSDGIHYDDGMHYIPIYQETLDDQWKTDGKFPPILDDIYRFMFDYGYTILVDWLNSHHFDYRGLIEKGLAIAVTEKNNPY